MALGWSSPRNSMNQVTRIVSQINDGSELGSEQLLPLVYEELRRLAAARLNREDPGQTLDPTGLVHEAYVRLVDQTNPPQWNGRGHFFGAAAEAMRRILIDRARQKSSVKRGGKFLRQALGDVVMAKSASSAVDLIALDEALTKLESLDRRKAQVVKLRLFAGLTNEEVALALGVSPATSHNDWIFAKSWLRVEMDPESSRA